MCICDVIIFRCICAWFFKTVFLLVARAVLELTM